MAETTTTADLTEVSQAELEDITGGHTQTVCGGGCCR
jgi:hypothetical protein